MRFGICTTSWMLPKTLRMRFFAPELRCAGWAALVAMLYLPCSKFFPPLSGIAADSQDQFPRKKVRVRAVGRSEEHPSELPYLMRISYAVFCLKKKKTTKRTETMKYNTKTT